ncbi:MAG: CoA-binding protein [Candidatus Lokiarchaeota archaeon]|nr:CoA-binding protein [Candidatus Lokiarchaeota archaeon]
MEYFFNPKKIVVVGATANPRKFGNVVTSNILSNKERDYIVYLVSLKKQKINGLGTYESILDIPDSIDLAIILVPAPAVEEIIDSCIKKAVKGIIIVSGGFGEINETGKILERRIANKCKQAGIRVIGPNCVGIQNLDIGLNASFILTPPKGKVSFITQSGSFGAAVLYAMNNEHLGCSKFANLGNMIDVSYSEVLDYLNKDPNTDVICMYLESVADGRDFFSSIKQVIPNKPILVLKGGRTVTGMSAASSHTGSLSTNYQLLKSAVDQAGGHMIEYIADYTTALKAFAYFPIPQGNRIGVMTNSGGSSVLFSDQAERFGLNITEFSDELIERIRPHVIPLVKMVNPLDMIAGAREEQYYHVAKAMLESKDIDIVVGCCVITPFLEIQWDEHYRGMIRAWNETGRKKPMIPLLVFADSFPQIHALSEKEKITAFYTPYQAAYACKVLIDRMNYLKKIHEDKK